MSYTEVSRTNYDFCGYATRNDIRCSDGRTIRQNAFKDCDGAIVPIVYQHDHTDINKVLGHGLLENREDGVYIYGLFNDSELGGQAKECVAHGDIRGLSIYANKLKQKGGDVLHGMIREVSLVLAGANPGAYIESVVCHGEEAEDEMTAWYVAEEPILLHAENMEENKMTEEKTVKEVFDEAMGKLSQEEQNVIYAVIGYTADNNSVEHSEEGDYEMNHVFEGSEGEVLSHSDKLALFTEALETAKAKRMTLTDALNDECLAHGIDDMDMLFPNYHELNTTPEFIKNDDGWVAKVMSGIKHVPFAKIRTTFADIREGEARAKGYITGRRKKEEFFKLARRETSPTTIYKLQKFNRDDIIDITGFDVVAWINGEMRMMLEEEIARAILIGDGRTAEDEDKINEECVRPIWTDNELFTVNKTISVASNATEDQEAKAFIRAIQKAHKDRKGTGKATLYTTTDMLTKCLLMEDTIGHVIYDSVDKLASALRVAGIVEVEPMEGCQRVVNGETRKLAGILVNLADYNFGADKGGQIESFEDFILDFNKYEYLKETRGSGALVKPFAAVALEEVYGLICNITPYTSDYLGKAMADIQENVFVNDTWISGDLKYVDSWDAYEPGAKGYFVCVGVEATDGATVTVKNTATGREVEVTDGVVLCKIPQSNAARSAKLVFTASKAGEADVVKTLSLGSLRCLPQD